MKPQSSAEPQWTPGNINWFNTNSSACGRSFYQSESQADENANNNWLGSDIK